MPVSIGNQLVQMAMRTERGVSHGRLLDADPANEHRQRHLSSLAEHKHE